MNHSAPGRTMPIFRMEKFLPELYSDMHGKIWTPRDNPP